MSPVFLRWKAVLVIHADQLRRYGGTDGLRDEGDVIVEPFARQRKEIVKDMAHGQHGRAGIDGTCG